MKSRKCKADLNTLFAKLQEAQSNPDLDRSLSNLVRILLRKKGTVIRFESTDKEVHVDSTISLDHDERSYHEGTGYCDRTIPGRHFSYLENPSKKKKMKNFTTEI